MSCNYIACTRQHELWMRKNVFGCNDESFIRFKALAISPSTRRNSNDEPEKRTRHKTTIKSCHRGGEKEPSRTWSSFGRFNCATGTTWVQTVEATYEWRKNGLKLLAPETCLTEHDEIKTKSTREYSATTKQSNRRHTMETNTTHTHRHTAKRENDKLWSIFFSQFCDANPSSLAWIIISIGQVYCRLIDYSTIGIKAEPADACWTLPARRKTQLHVTLQLINFFLLAPH